MADKDTFLNRSTTTDMASNVKLTARKKIVEVDVREAKNVNNAMEKKESTKKKKDGEQECASDSSDDFFKFQHLRKKTKAVSKVATQDASRVRTLSQKLNNAPEEEKKKSGSAKISPNEATSSRNGIETGKQKKATAPVVPTQTNTRKKKEVVKDLKVEENGEGPARQPKNTVTGWLSARKVKEEPAIPLSKKAEKDSKVPDDSDSFPSSANLKRPREVDRARKKAADSPDEITESSSPMAKKSLENDLEEAFLSKIPGKKKEEKIDVTRILANAATISNDSLASMDLSLNLESPSVSLLSSASSQVQRPHSAEQSPVFPTNDAVAKRIEAGGPTDFRMLRSVLEGAEKFMHSDILGDIKRDACTLGGSTAGEQRIGSKLLPEHVLTCQEDLQKLPGKFSKSELWLMSCPAYRLEAVYLRTLHMAVTYRKEHLDGSGEAPSLSVMLAYLAHAAATSVASLLPGGEEDGQAERVIQARLKHDSLPIFKGSASDRLAWHASQTTRVLRLFSIAPLNGLSMEDRTLLIFAVSRLYIDSAANGSLRIAALALFRNIFMSTVSFSELLPGIAAVFPLITDSLYLMHLILLAFRSADCPTPAVLAIVVNIFIHLSERAECAPPTDLKMSNESIFVRTYLEVIVDTYHDLFDLFRKEKSKNNLSFFLSLVNVALAPCVLKFMTAEQSCSLRDAIDYEKTSLSAASHPDDALLVTQLDVQKRRIETWTGQKKRGFLFNDDEMEMSPPPESSTNGIGDPLSQVQITD